MGQIYNHLSNDERNFIQRHLNLGQSCRWIAGRLKRSPTGISGSTIHKVNLQS